jgi:glycosyltransferase involved in cell wall biosynthesis
VNILNVNMSIDPVTGGGTAERTIQMAKYLAKAGINSSILTCDIGMSHEFIKGLSGIDVKVLPCLLSRFYIPRFNYRELKKMVCNTDIVHLMNHWTLINAIIYIICEKLGKPYVVCPAGALPSYGRSRLLKKMYNALIGTRMIQNASRHIAIPAEEANQYLEYGIDPQSVDVIPNGINPKDFNAEGDSEFRKKHCLGDKPFILFMGRLNIIKGPDILLQAFAGIKAKFPDHNLVFAGPDGGMLSKLNEIVRKYNLEDCVHFIGYIGGEEKSWAYHSTELLVIPSRQEAMSIVAIEAGVTGTPVLMTDVCGFNQVGQIGGGIIVKPTITEIQKGLLVLEDTGKLKRMGNILKNFVLDHYTWDSVINKYIILFEDILSAS